MELKEKINADYVVAMKTKDVVTKSALNGLKAKITESEKSNGNKPLSNDEILKVITSAVKQRKQSYDEFIKGKREDLAIKEQEEMIVFQQYLPTQMSEEEIDAEVKILLSEVSTANLTPQVIVGKTMGSFNKKFQGRADIAKVKQIIEKNVL
jgi:hypothetical protein